MFPGSPLGWLFPGDPGVPSTLAPTRWNNFAPRVGLAYSFGDHDGMLSKILGKQGTSSIRAGWGMFYTSFEGATDFNEIGDAPFGNYTGQYGTRTGVTQTDGLFKSGDSGNFPWLDASGIPTLGTWMQEAGYTTHYFGKWHVSNPPEHSLKRYGFDDWESSYPEPHGSQSNNLGVYRDVGFTDSACAFIRRRGLALDYDRVSANMQSHDPDYRGPNPSAPRASFHRATALSFAPLA